MYCVCLQHNSIGKHTEPLIYRNRVTGYVQLTVTSGAQPELRWTAAYENIAYPHTCPAANICQLVCAYEAKKGKGCNTFTCPKCLAFSKHTKFAYILSSEHLKELDSRWDDLIKE